MNKKGEIVVLAIAFAIIVLTTIGVVVVYDASKSLYMGNTETEEYFNYYDCPERADQIPDENLIVFKSRENAEKENYKAIEGCT